MQFVQKAQISIFNRFNGLGDFRKTVSLLCAQPISQSSLVVETSTTMLGALVAT
jgi:hypothetical protein